MKRLLAICLLLSGCAVRNAVDQEPTPLPHPLSRQARAAVVMPTTERVSVSFSHPDPDVTITIYYGWSEDAATNVLGTTTSRALVDVEVVWPPDAGYIYVRGDAVDSLGQWSGMSYAARYPDFEPNAVAVWSEPHVPGQVMVWESPNLRHWVGYYTTLPVTNAITSTTFYMLQAGSSQPSPFEARTTALRLWDPVKKHFGK